MKSNTKRVNKYYSKLVEKYGQFNVDSNKKSTCHNVFAYLCSNNFYVCSECENPCQIAKNKS